MTEQQWLEAKRKGEALRARIESNICNVLVKSGVMADCLAYIEAAEQGVQWTCESCGATDMFSNDICVECGASQ